MFAKPGYGQRHSRLGAWTRTACRIDWPSASRILRSTPCETLARRHGSTQPRFRDIRRPDVLAADRRRIALKLETSRPLRRAKNTARRSRLRALRARASDEIARTLDEKS